MATDRRPSPLTATILNGASQSDVIHMKGHKLAGLILPAAWTTAALTFLVSDRSSGTFVPLYDDNGVEVTIASGNVAASRAIALDGIAGSVCQWGVLKLRSGTSGTPVNQGADRAIVVVVKE